jgi:hypothetical protein
MNAQDDAMSAKHGLTAEDKRDLIAFLKTL